MKPLIIPETTLGLKIAHCQTTKGQKKRSQRGGRGHEGERKMIKSNRVKKRERKQRIKETHTHTLILLPSIRLSLWK